MFTTVPAGRTFFHTVARGDTLQGVAARYGVTTQDLKRWNNLTQDGVRKGQKLRVTSDVSPIKAAGHGRATKGARAKGSKGKSGVAAGRGRAGQRQRRQDVGHPHERQRPLISVKAAARATKRQMQNGRRVERRPFSSVARYDDGTLYFLAAALLGGLTLDGLLHGPALGAPSSRPCA